VDYSYPNLPVYLGIAAVVAAVAAVLAVGGAARALTTGQRRRIFWPPMLIAALALGVITFLLIQPIGVMDGVTGSRACGRVLRREEGPDAAPTDIRGIVERNRLEAECSPELDRFQRVATAFLLLFAGCVALTGYQVWHELRRDEAPPTAAGG